MKVKSMYFEMSLQLLHFTFSTILLLIQALINFLSSKNSHFYWGMFVWFIC